MKRSKSNRITSRPIDRLGLLYRTLRSLTPLQFAALVRQRLQRPLRGLSSSPHPLVPPSLAAGRPSPQLWLGDQQFSFLNRTADVRRSPLLPERQIDWNFAEEGKLWCYNLNYFDWLQQPNLPVEVGLAQLRDFVAASHSRQLLDGVEPYPISLRLYNWGRFLSHHQIDDPLLWGYLRAEWKLLMRRVEWHLQANHLLENLLVLLWGALLFSSKSQAKKQSKALQRQLQKQFGNDGGHCEASAMYQLILLGRMVDLIELLGLRRDLCDDEQFVQLLRLKTEQGLGWLQQVVWNDGSIPHLNDATDGVAPRFSLLLEQAVGLGLSPKQLPLSDSGFRRWNGAGWELCCDVGSVGPAYQPGHSHADDLSFELRLEGQPLIVDTGISTYEANALRLEERGSAAHNTVQWRGENSSEVWSSFRIGRRSKVTVLCDQNRSLEAVSNGYALLGGPHHRRRWERNSCGVLTLFDWLESPQTDGRIWKGVARFHLAPGVVVDSLSQSENHLSCTLCQSGKSLAILTFSGDGVLLRQLDGKVARGFNLRVSTVVLELSFKNRLQSQFSTVPL